MPRILGLGDNTVDTYVDAGLQYPGGNAVNVAVLAHRLGAKAGYLGCLGNDAAGRLVWDVLAAEGLDVSRVRRLDGPNARARIGHRAGDRIFLGSIRGVRAQYGGFDAADLAYIAGFDLTHSSIYSELGEDLPRLRAAAKRLSFDFSERWSDDAFAAVLPHLDIAFLSCPKLDEAATLDLLRDCAARGPGIVVATRGAAGAIAWGEGSAWYQPAAPAQVVDTLGAGDGFIAGFLVAHLRGQGMGAALAAGAELAAQVCGWHGAFGRGIAWTDIPEDSIA